jgi:polyadenylate-binding protein
LALGWCHKELYEAFAKFGKILSTKASLTGDHKSKGYGYICFEKADSAKAAIAEMNNKSVNGAVLGVKYYTAKGFVEARVTRNNLYVKGFPKDDMTEQDLIVSIIVD